MGSGILIKMIVVDLDGTILNDKRELSTDTESYLKRLKDMGYVITIATGRVYASALKATRGAIFADYIISDTGAYIYDHRYDNPILTNPIPKDIVRSFFKYYNDDCLYIDVCGKDYIYKYSDIKEESNIVHTTKDKEYIFTHCSEVSHVVISMKNNIALMRLYQQLLQDFSNLNIMIMQDSFSDRKWLEITMMDCSKYYAIKKLSKQLNISNDEIMAFGDGLNDTQMIEKCGMGIALKNALEEVKEVADDITLYDHNHDGVIHYLEEYFHVY